MKRALIISVFLILILDLWSQEINIVAEYPSVVETGQQFNISWTVNAGGGEWSAPAFTGFYKLVGPQTSYSSSMQMNGSKVTREISYTYTYFLQAMEPGKYVLPPARFTLKNKAYFSDSIRIEVVAGGQQRPGQAQPQDNEGDVPVETGSQDLFVSLRLNRTDVYLGEPVAASVKIYTRVNLSGINEIKYPSFDKFLKTDLETPPLTSLKEETVNGRRYGTGVVQQFLLYPQVSGDITIDPVQLTLLVQQRSGQSDPFFGDFFAQYQTVPRAVASKPVKIRVKPLPGTRPADFSGIIGNIDLKASIDKDSVNVNDAVTLKITVNGTGNLKIAGNPLLKLSPDIEAYDPKITDEIRNSVTGATGKRTFEFLLIPRHYGDFSIPPVTYSFFNTSSGRYETLTTREFRFHARKGTEQNTGITVFGGVAKEDVKYLGKDIRFIKNESGRIIRADKVLNSKRVFLTFYAAGIIIFLVVLILRREHVKRNSDISAVRNRKAGRVAVKRLRQAEACLKDGDNEKFYEEILKALWGYLSDKLSIPMSELTRRNAVEILVETGVNESDTSDLISLLDICEYARYAPSAAGTEPSEVYRKASDFIKSVENKIG